MKRAWWVLSMVSLTNAAWAQSASVSEDKGYTLGGYVESYYAWNFAEPQNGSSNYRGFDSRHNSITLSNVVLDAKWDTRGVVGRVALQVGHTGASYYAGEPSLSAAAGTNASNAELWRYVQQANLGYKLDDIADGMVVSAGLFLSPIGPESMAVHDNWNWSRSNLFYGLPYYHTGARVSAPLSERWSTTVAVYNGWNSVSDNNAAKSVAVQFGYTIPQKLNVSLMYFGGNEREAAAPEGPAWRHSVDAFATWTVSERVSLQTHANGGFEPNRMGTSWWAAGAQSLRLKLGRNVYASLREDLFYEQKSLGFAGVARPIFWPAEWVASGTATLDYRPRGDLSLMLEYRHDAAAERMYAASNVLSDAPDPGARTQDTLTCGATAWF